MFRVRSRLLTTTALTAAAAAGATAFAFQSQADEDRVLHLTGTTQVDTRPGRPQAGDDWTGYLSLYGPHHRPTGDGSSRCSAVHVSPHGVITQCQYVLRTRDGNLVLTGMTNRWGSGPYSGMAAIGGGTGEYTGAAGTARVTTTGRRVAFRIAIDE
jgi:hypothetical protein